MKRRELLALGAVTLVTPGMAASAAANHVTYSRSAYEAALASGEAFMLDFFAPW